MRELVVYSQMCGWTLARAHARSGDRIAIAAYLGKGPAFDQALAQFADGSRPVLVATDLFLRGPVRLDALGRLARCLAQHRHKRHFTLRRSRNLTHSCNPPQRKPTNPSRQP